METLTIPYSGELLVTHMIAYGLTVALEHGGVDTFIEHDLESLEMTPRIRVDADLDLVVQCIRESAVACELAVERDLEPGKTGNARIPVLRARATESDQVTSCFEARERLIAELESGGADAGLALALASGLGTPAVWLRADRSAAKSTPHRGASALDGVPYNIGSDIVRGALRRSRPAAAAVSEAQVMALLLGGCPERADEADDRHRWSPGGTLVASWCQWLAALGLCLLPVGLQASSPALTPGCQRRRVTLPILSAPTSVPRLRAMLELRDLAVAIAEDGSPEPQAAGRLRAQGVRELVTFQRLEASNATMVSFSFGLAARSDLRVGR